MGDLLRRASRILRARWLRATELAEPWSGGEAEAPERERRGAGRAASAGEAERARALALLELGPSASADEIRSAYRRMCLRYHPDFFADDELRSRAANELLAEINRAYELLTS